MKQFLFTLLIGLGLATGAQPSWAQSAVISATSEPTAFDIRRTQVRTVARRDYALLIANGRYDDARFKALPNCSFDVDALNKQLETQYGFVTEIRNNLNYSDFEAKLAEYAEKTWQDNDQLLIYIAGHGGFKTGINQGFLVMKDTDKVKQNPSFSLPNLQNILSNLSCKHILVILDVCYGGTFDYAIAMEGDVLRGEPVSSPALSGPRRTDYVLQKLKPQSRIYLASGGKEPVSEGRQGEHSPFAKALLQTLDHAAAGTDKLLTIYELTSALDKDVPTIRMGTFGNNQPGGNFLFIAR